MSGLTQSAGLQVFGGNKYGANGILCPSPGHKKIDRSMSVRFGSQYPEGFVAYSFSGHHWQECRDYVRDKMGLPAWTPDRKQEQPVFKAREYIYLDAEGNEHHRVDALSDGSFRHYHYDLDGWKPKAPDLIIPYALSDLDSDETVYLVRGEANAELVRDGFGHVATTYPSGLDVHADASFLHHLRDKDVVILDTGGAKSADFCTAFSEAMGVPVTRLPDGVRTLRDFSKMEFASLEDLPTALAEPQPSTAKVKATPFQWVSPETIAPRAWLYGHHLIRRFVSLTVSPGGIGKSSLVLMEALCMASGKSLLLDDKCRTPEPLRVWYWNGEDPQDETQRRVIAAAIHHGLTPSDIGGRLYTDTGREQTITLGQIARGEISLDEDLFDELEAEIIARRIDVFILDPFVSAHRMGENDNNAIDAVVKRLGKLAERANCAVEIVHHVRKPGGGAKEATDVNDARGASALVGGVRSARVLNIMSEDIAKEIDGMSLDDRFSYFSVTNGKANMTKRSGEGKWRHLVDLDLKNGPPEESDHVGVVCHYKLPDRAAALDALPDNAVMIAQKAAYDHPEQSRLDPQSHDWFGHTVGRVMGINSVDKEGNNILKTAIAVWLKSGALVVQIRPDHRRKPKEYVSCPTNEMPLQSTFEPEDDTPF